MGTTLTDCPLCGQSTRLTITTEDGEVTTRCLACHDERRTPAPLPVIVLNDPATDLIGRGPMRRPA
jgi:hypothetical protein